MLPVLALILLTGACPVSVKPTSVKTMSPPGVTTTSLTPISLVDKANPLLLQFVESLRLQPAILAVLPGGTLIGDPELAKKVTVFEDVLMNRSKLVCRPPKPGGTVAPPSESATKTPWLVANIP